MRRRVKSGPCFSLPTFTVMAAVFGAMLLLVLASAPMARADQDPQAQISFTGENSETPPTIGLLTPSVNGLRVAVNGVTQATAPGASVTSISWNWGDGQTTTGWFPATHFYVHIGTYTIVATATDTNGQSKSASTQVTVVFSQYPVTPRGPISITGDSSFTPGNGVNGGGTGTNLDPYIIVGWAIDASGATGITIENTTKYFVIRNCLVENSGDSNFGILLYDVINGKVENNTCENDVLGIALVSSSSNTLTNNTCGNKSSGIYLDHSSNNNILDNNTCSNNPDSGIYVGSSSYNVLVGNACENNSWGILLASSDNNTVSHNYLLNNRENNAFDGGTNYWDNNGRGNYWSDWQPPGQPSSNGIVVDTPRPIAGGTNQDRYPLVMISTPTQTPTPTPTTTPTLTPTPTPPQVTGLPILPIAIAIAVIIVVVSAAYVLRKRK